MAEVKWIKIVTGIFDDEKIQLIDAMPDADAILVIWFKLLCLAGRCNRNGLLMMNDRLAYTDGMLSAIFRRKESTIKLALATFEQFGMIEIVDNVITISNWEKHQNIEGMEKIREQNRIRQQNRRVKLADASRDSHVTVTQGHATEREEEKEREKEEEIIRESKERKPQKRFTAPTHAEVRAYCQERNKGINADRFFEYYEARAWEGIRDWKSAVRAWETNGIDRKDGQPEPSYDIDGIMAAAVDFDPTKTKRGEV